jgi:hypothetical protein
MALHPHTHRPARIDDGPAYIALRQGGAPPERVRLQLDLGLAAARRLERAFRSRVQRGPPEAPKFARHDAHVAAVMAQGGFCAFSERRIGKDGMVVCLPLIWPEAAHG